MSKPSFYCANDQSAENLSRALALKGSMRPDELKPLIVINGDRPATGKSVLARIILEAVLGEKRRFCMAAQIRNEKHWIRAFQQAMRNGYLLVEDVFRIRSEALRIAVNSREWCHSTPGQLPLVTPQPWMVITGNRIEVDAGLLDNILRIDLTDERNGAQKITLPFWQP